MSGHASWVSRINFPLPLWAFAKCEALAKALAQSARPASWNADTAAATPSPPGSLAAWHEVVDPIYGLERRRRGARAAPAMPKTRAPVVGHPFRANLS